MISEQQLRNYVRLTAFKAGGQKVYAAMIGVSEAVLSLFTSGARKPSKHLLNALGYERVVR
jgi:DNA-binding transcriptional regulator YdaS (Cro superfamily)